MPEIFNCLVLLPFYRQGLQNSQVRSGNSGRKQLVFEPDPSESKALYRMSVEWAYKRLLSVLLSEKINVQNSSHYNYHYVKYRYTRMWVCFYICLAYLAYP